MSFADVQNKTELIGYSADDEATILAAMKTAYEGSDTARAMFESWIAVPDRKITIAFFQDAAAAGLDTGRVALDLKHIAKKAYIDNYGTAVQTTPVMALVHELVHALTGLDDYDELILGGATNDYRQPTVIRSNIIYKDLGIPEQNSYIAHTATGEILTLNFQYTNGAKIDRSVASPLVLNWDSSMAFNSKDLLIGDARNNTLTAGDGDDFLYGKRGDDKLNGGEDNDTLDGGLGNDTLKGGEGFDTYLADSDDEITDSDGKGEVKLNGQTLRGGKRKKSDPPNIYKASDGVTYELQGSTLLVDGLTIKDYQRGDLGIQLVDEDDPINKIRKKIQNASTIKSPIVLDLDGDGVETLSIDGHTSFDHAGDSFAELTGWVGNDDGLLVRDLDGNERIDTGRELFGSETRLPNGSKAANGFAALSSLDANGDGVIDTLDAAYSELRVWKDADGNGRTDTGELLTLEEAGVRSINVAHSNSSMVDAQGNAHRQVGSYTTTDGQARAATDVWVKTDTTYSVPTASVEVSDDIAQLPDAQGYGKVRDLHQAMAMDGTGKLQALVTAFTLPTTPFERDALVTQIIYHWTGVQDVDPSSRASRMIYGNAIGDARKLEALEEFLGEEWAGTWCWGERDPNPHGRAAPVLLAAWDELKALVYGQLITDGPLKPLFQQIVYRRDEAVGGVVGDLSVVATTLSGQILADRETGLNVLGEFVYSLKGLGLLDSLDMASFSLALLSLGPDVVQTMDVALAGWLRGGTPTDGDDRLIGSDFDDVIYGLGGNDRLLARGGKDRLYGGVGNDVLDGGAGNDLLDGGAGSDLLDGGAGNDELRNDGGGSDTYSYGRGDGHDTISDYSWSLDEIDRIKLKAGLSPQDVRLERVPPGYGEDLKITIRDTGETLTVKYHFFEGNRYGVDEVVFADGTVWNAETIKSRSLLGDAGEDLLHGFHGRDDFIEGSAGDDVLSGLSGNDMLEGGSGDDELSGGEGNDTLLSGDGDDTLSGGSGDDAMDGGAGNDRLSAGVGADTMEGGSGNDELIGGDGNDSLLGGDGHDTLWGDFGDDVMDGGAGNDKLFASAGADTLEGGSGNDELSGGEGNDTLSGGDGDDTLNGDSGDDVMDGGAGNDNLSAGVGVDTIRFGRGDGQDTLVADRNLDSYYRRYYSNLPLVADGNNTVELKAGITAADIKLTRVDKDLVISIRDTTDTLTVKSFLNSISSATPELDQFNLLSIRFADGTSWGPQEMLAQTLLGDAAAETLIGFSSSETFDGAGGDDTSYGNGGGDTYLFGRGDGKDRVYGNGDNGDTLRFKEGISAQDVQVRRVGDAAVFTILDTGESVTFVSGFYPSGSTHGIQILSSVQFADGSTWTRDQIDQQAIEGTAGDDLLLDVLTEGVTTLSGGAGADTLQGTRGATVYAFSRGDGQDTIVENYNSIHDTIQFGEDIVASDLVVAIQGDDLVIGISGSSDQITIKGDRGARVEFFEVGGVTLSYDLILGLIESEVSETILGSEDSDTLIGTAKRSHIVGFEGDDSLVGNDGNDNLEGGAGSDSLHGNAGMDTLSGGEGDDALDGGIGSDQLEGGEGSDVLFGGEGDDSLTGGLGNDILNGGLGRDMLAGGGGSNIYRYERGGALDRVTLDSTSADSVELGAGISLADITVQAGFELDPDSGAEVLNRLVIGFGGNDALLLEAPYGAPLDPMFAQSLSLTLSDGTVLNFEDIVALKDDGVVGSQFVYEPGTAVLGSQADDNIESYEDGLYVDGRDNNDVIYVGGAAALVYGGAGDDELTVSNGAVVAGGAGNDKLSASYGSSNTFVFNAGDGKDRLVDGFAQGALSFGASISAGDVRIWIDTSNGDLVFSIGAGQDEVRTAWYDLELAAPLYGQALAMVQFIDSDGGVRQYDLQKIMASPEYGMANIGAPALPANALVLQDASEFLSAAARPVMGGTAAIAYAQTGDLRGSYFIAANADPAADNLLFGTPDADTLDGQGGNDVVIAGAENDLVWGGEGDDYLDGQAGDDQIDGGEGNDILQGGRGADRLTGGRGINEAYGGSGYDTYVYTRGDGQIYIEDLGGGGEEGGEGGYGGYGGYGGSLYENELVFGPGIALSDLSFSRSGNNLVVTVAGDAGDVITLAGFDEERLSGNRSIERFVFQAGPSLELSDIWSSPEVTVVTSGNEFIQGTFFNDELRGDLEADELQGGEGNDRLVGGGGDDAYLIEDEDGNDTIVDSATDANLVVFTGSVTADEIRLTVEGGISTIHYRSSSIVLDGWDGLDAALAPVSQFLFSDGGALSMNELFNRPRVILGTPQADVLNGADGDDEIEGLQGNDVMQGGAGADTYYIESDSGQDTITDLSTLGQQNTIIFGDITDPASLRLTLNAEGSLVVFLDGGNSVTLTNFNRLTPQGERTIEFFQFGFSGPVLTYDQLLERGFVIEGTQDSDLLQGTSLHDVFTAGDGDDTMEGSTGSDELNGGLGNDRYEYNMGDGLVTINDIADASGGNVLRFGPDISPESIERKLRFIEDPVDASLNRFVIVFDENNQISISGFDRTNPTAGTHGIESFEFADGTVMSWDQFLDNGFVVEGDGDGNTLQGTGRSDSLHGYEGADNLQGGAGDDAYVFNRGDGVDTIVDSGAIDFNYIRFGANIRPEDIRREWDGTTLVLRYSDEDAVQIDNFYSSEGNPVILAAVFEDGTVVSLTEQMNRAPVAARQLEDTVATEDQDFSLTIPADLFSDPDASDEVRVAVQLASGEPLPTWLRFDPVTGTLSGRPANADVGDLELVVVGTDHFGAAISTAFAISVQNTNDAPEAYTPVSAQSALEDSAFSFTLPADSFRDVDVGDVLTYSVALANGDPLPSWLTFDAASRTFSGTPLNQHVGSLSLSVTATDASGATATSAFDVAVSNTNDAPVLGTAMGDQTATEDQPFSFTVSGNAFADQDLGDSLSYSATLADGSPLPSWLSLDAATGAFAGVPANGDVGVLSVNLTATDTSGAAVSTSFALTVGNVNDAPTAALPLNDQAATEDASFSFTIPAGSFADVDAGDTLTYTARLANGGVLPSWLVFDAATQTFSGTPLNADVGLLGLSVTATDASGASVSSTFDMVVGNTNDGPTVSVAVADQAATEDQAFSFTVPGNAFTDEDLGDSLSYTATLANGDALPSWLSFDAATGLFSGTPANAHVGTLSIALTATDASGASVTDTFNVAIANVNDAPVVARVIDSQATAQNQPFSFTLPANTFTDIDAGDTLVLSATLADGNALPGWLSFDAATGTFAGTPANGDVGTVSVKVTATDAGGLTATSHFDMAVSNVNDAPVVAQALADQAATQDQAFNFVVPANTFIDMDAGDTLAYSATLANGDALPTWLSFDASTGSFSGTPANGDVGALSVRVLATDTSGASATSLFTLAVANVNDGPMLAQPLADASTAEDAAFSYTLPADAFSDIDAGDQLSYTATLANGDALPTWLSFNAVSGVFSGMPLNADVGSVDVRVTATDASGATASDVFSIAVTNTNDAPVLVNAMADQTPAEDAGFTFTVPADAFADVDVGDSLGYMATLANGNALPSWLNFNTATRTFSGTPANGDVGTINVLVTATDGFGASTSDVFALNVSNTNDAPVAANDLGSAVEDGGPVTLTAAALLANDTDVDAGDGKHISAVAATSAAGAAVSLVNGNIVYQPGNLFQSLGQGVSTTDTFSYTMADSAGAASTATVTMTITGTNDAPVLALQTAAQTATQGAAFTLSLPTGTFSDADAGDTLSWSASLANGSSLPAWLVFNAATRTFSGTPGSNDVGALSLRVTATDQLGASVADNFALTVQSGNTQGQTLIGTAGNDVLNGTPYDDIIDGRAGNDTLNGGAGKDLLNGGTGSDRLTGDAGDDTLAFSTDATWNGSHRALHAGSPGNAGTGEQVSLSGKNRSYDLFNGGAGQDALVGSNGHDALFLDDTYSPPDGYVGPRIQQIELISMEGGNDIVDLTSRRYAYGDVTLDGGTGNDVLWASSGNDQLLGGAGNDQLDGGAGNDILDGGEGNDQLKGGVGNDILGGGAGNDSLEGGAGDDVLDGSAGNDDLAGGQGNDIYVHGLNGGADVIEEQGGQDVIRFTAGISASAVSVSRHNNDLVLKLSGQNGSVTVEDWFDSSAERVERVEFADGTVWDENALRARASRDSGGGRPGNHDRDEGCGGGGNNRNNHGRDDKHASNDRDDEPHDKKKNDKPDRLEDAINQINERLAKAPRHDFGSLAAYLSQQGGSTGPLTAAQIARQWGVVRSSIQGLGQDDSDVRKGVQIGRFGSGDDLVQGAMHWGYAGSVGQAGAAGGMTSLTGLAEGFKKLA